MLRKEDSPNVYMSVQGSRGLKTVLELRTHPLWKTPKEESIKISRKDTHLQIKENQFFVLINFNKFAENLRFHKSMFPHLLIGKINTIKP